MKILITGGTGFIGSSLAKSLLSDGHQITVVDNFMTSRISNILDIMNDIRFVEIDLANMECKNDIDYLIHEADIVFHFAASIGVKLIQEDPHGTLRNSMNINNNLFPLFEKHKTKVIFASTSEVYGETKHDGGSCETDKLEINSPHIPRGGYACSKLMAEFLLRSYDFPSVICRFFNVVGPSQTQDYGHVLPRFIDCINTGEYLPVYGDGQQVRSYCDIRDAIEMLKILMDSKHVGEIYNIGNSVNVCTVNELAETVIRITNSDNYIKHIPIGSQFGEIYRRFPNTHKIQKYYECKYSLEDIIKYVIQESV